MITKPDPYASEKETQALLVRDTRTEAERKLAAMMAERGADEQGAEAYPILWSIALDTLEAKPTFTGLPKRKLYELLAANWRINGVSIEREEDGVTKRGAVTTGGMVLWWDAEQIAQPQQESVSFDVELWLGQPRYHDGFGRSPDLWSLAQIQSAVASMLAAAQTPSQGVSL